MGKEACYLVEGGGTRVYCCPYLKGQGTYISHWNKTRTKREEKNEEDTFGPLQSKTETYYCTENTSSVNMVYIFFFLCQRHDFFINLCFLFKLKINIRT